MNPLIAEFLGTAILVLFGNGVVANVVLAKTKGNGGGLIAITIGWGLAVFVGALCSAHASGAHLNPALTIGLAVAGKFAVAKTLGYILAQLLGAMAGAALVYYYYRLHFLATENSDDKLACFCTSPNLGSNSQAFFCEMIGTLMLVLPILLIEPVTLKNVASAGANELPSIGLGTLGLLPVALLVVGIGLSLGGTTGYAINPARDFGPRLIHHLLPIVGKRDANWGYAWVPVAGPISGAVLAALIYLLLT